MESAFQSPRMHIPPAYAVAEHELREELARRPFGHLVTCGASGLRTTATPFIFETDAGGERYLVGHIAGRNGQASDLVSGMSALAVFGGPQAYVSPRWYREKPDLPTWNYVGIQVHGTLEPIDDEPGKRRVLSRTAEVMERHRAEPWSLEEADPERVATLLPHIRAFRFAIERLEGAHKLSQNKPPVERLNVIRGLLESGEPDALAVAKLMAAGTAPGSR